MKLPFKYWPALLLIISLLGAGRVLATTFETVESTFLGNGWFQYDVKTFHDPFFAEAEITTFGISITNGVDIEYGANPANWVDEPTNYAFWDYTGTDPETRPNEQVFLMHSSASSYMLGTNAVSVYSLVTSDIFPNGNVGAIFDGYSRVPCLLPCPPELADGSPTNHLEIIVLVPDMVIDKLLVGPTVYGLDFNWISDSTDLLQASTDLIHWTNVTYIWGTAGETQWTTNSHLLDSGQFFRLQLAAGFQTTNVAPLFAGASVQTSSLANGLSTSAGMPRVTGCRPKGDVVSVQIATTPGQSGQVRALNSAGVVLETQPFGASSNSVVVTFNSRNFTGPVLFQVLTK